MCLNYKGPPTPPLKEKKNSEKCYRWINYSAQSELPN